MTLHDAIKEVFFIKKSNNLEIGEIRDTIASEKLYSPKEGITSISANQISARINKYPKLFEIQGKNVSLINGSLERLKVFHNKLLDIMKTIGTLDNTFISSTYFFLRVIANKDRYASLIKNDFNATLEGLSIFYSNISDVNSKFDSLAFRTIGTLTIISKQKVANELNMLLGQISLTEKEYSNETFNDFLYESVLLTPFLTSTPLKITKLISEIVKDFDCNNIYNPAAGVGRLTTSLSISRKVQNDFYGEEVNETAYNIGLINLALNGFSLNNFERKDSLYDNFPNNYFDLIVCYPPFNLKSTSITEYDVPIKSNDFTNVIIQRSLQKISENGKAIIIVPESSLYSTNKEDKTLREHLVTNNLIEQVISLPSGMFGPLSSIKTNILILGRTSSNGITFSEYQDKEFQSTKATNDLSIIAEPKSFYGGNKMIYIKEEQIDNDFNLVASKYLNITEVKNDPELVKLGMICERFKNLKSCKDKTKLYLNIKDLNKHYYDIYVEESLLKYNSKERPGRLINKNALLIGSIEGSFKPTLFRYSDDEIIVSPNIHILSLNIELVDPEYLIFEFASSYVTQQLNAFSIGATSLRRINIKDLLSIQIRIPSLEKQREILKEKKESLISARINDVNMFADLLGVSKLKEKELLGFVEHEVGNIVGGAKSNLRNLKYTLKTLDIDFTTKISTRENAPSLDQTINTIEQNLKDVDDLMTNIQAIIDLGNDGLKVANVSFKEFISSEVKKTKEFELFNIHIYYDNEKIEKKNPKFAIDTKQFGVVIKNFIKNSKVHGLIENGKGNLAFNLNEDDDYYYLSLINDGKPFPVGFSLEDFLSFGGRFDPTNGSGLGGFLMNKVVENHNGEIQLMDSGTAFYLGGKLEEPQFIEPTFIKVGVHFLITIPKNEL